MGLHLGLGLSPSPSLALMIGMVGADHLAETRITPNCTCYPQFIDKFINEYTQVPNMPVVSTYTSQEMVCSVHSIS